MSKQEEIKQALAAATQGEPKGMTLRLMGERDYWRSEFHKVFSQRERALEENERLRKELEEAQKQSAKWEKAFDNADKQYLKKEQEAAVLRRKLEKARKVAKIYRKATSDIHNTLRWGDSENALERVETIIELALVQEGEGNQ